MPDRGRESLKMSGARGAPDLEMHEPLPWFLINCLNQITRSGKPQCALRCGIFYRHGCSLSRRIFLCVLFCGCSFSPPPFVQRPPLLSTGLLSICHLASKVTVASFARVGMT